MTPKGSVGCARQVGGRDVAALRWVGEQYTVRADMLAVLMASASDDPEARERGRLLARVVNRRVQAWRDAGLVNTKTFLVGTPATVVKRAAAGLDQGAERIFVKAYPPPTLAEVA